MPTTYTHYAYGQEIRQRLSVKIQELIRSREDFYNIGVHGPDILFYYRAFSKNAVNQTGVKIHHEDMSEFLRNAFSVWEIQADKEAAFSYLAGFMTHFALDSACHPYIAKRIRETGISHTEIERDLDVRMMKRDHHDPLTFPVTGHIHTGQGYGRVIAPFFGRTPEEVEKSLYYMKLILDHIFRSPYGITEQAATMLNQKFFPDKKFSQYFVKRKTNPDNAETCRELRKRYEGSRDFCAEAIEEMYEALQAKDDRFCEKECFRKDFM